MSYQSIVRESWEFFAEDLQEEEEEEVTWRMPIVNEEASCLNLFPHSLSNTLPMPWRVDLYIALWRK